MKCLPIALILLAVPAASQQGPVPQVGPAQPFPGATLTRSAVLRVPTPDCNAVELVPNLVPVTWPDVPTEDTVAKLPPSSSSDLLLLNTTTEVLTYELKGLFVADGQRLDLTLGSGTLSASSSQTVPVPFSGFGVDLIDLDFSGSLMVQAEIKKTSGVLLDRSYAPVVFFHQGPTGALLLYGREARRTMFFAGDLKNRFFSSIPPASVMGVFDGGAGPGADAEDFGPPDVTPPGPSGQWEFCMRWVYQSIDSGFGEDYYQQGQYMKARGMRVEVDHPNWASPLTLYANKDNGCFSFAAVENMDFKVTIFAEARLGDGDDIFVKTFDTKQQAALDDVATWVQVVNPGGAPRRIYLQNEAAEESNVMAFGSFVLHWVDSHTSPGLPGPKTVKILTDNPDCAGSCQPYDYVEMKPGDGNRKFLVGHEMGHWIHRKWSISLGLNAGAYDADSGGAFCEFNGVGSHAMRSRETSAGAFIEGFAHYLSALAWNDHDDTEGWFKYYKEIDGLAYEDFKADNWLVDLEGDGPDPSGGVTAWMENQCFVVAGHSVEMDWLRFYWDYRTVSAVLLPRPSHYEIFQHIWYTRNSYGWSNLNTYDHLELAIDDVALGQVHETRWEVFAGINGIDH